MTLMTMLLLTVPPVSAVAQTTTVHFRLVDTETGQTTPAMVCITGTSEGDVRLPADGRVCTQPSRTETFYRGVRFEPDRNWIGPVRKTLGRGDNDDRGRGVHERLDKAKAFYADLRQKMLAARQ